MKREIEKILEDYKEGRIKEYEGVNAILLLFVINKDKFQICPLCKETILIDGMCPKCTVELCSPFDPDKK